MICIAKNFKGNFFNISHSHIPDFQIVASQQNHNKPCINGKIILYLLFYSSFRSFNVSMNTGHILTITWKITVMITNKSIISSNSNVINIIRGQYTTPGKTSNGGRAASCCISVILWHSCYLNYYLHQHNKVCIVQMSLLVSYHFD